MVSENLMIRSKTFCGAGMRILIFVCFFFFRIVLCDIVFAIDYITLPMVWVLSSKPKHFSLLILCVGGWVGDWIASSTGIIGLKFGYHLIFGCEIDAIFCRRYHVLMIKLEPVIINILLFWNHICIITIRLLIICLSVIYSQYKHSKSRIFHHIINNPSQAHFFLFILSHSHSFICIFVKYVHFYSILPFFFLLIFEFKISLLSAHLHLSSLSTSTLQLLDVNSPEEDIEEMNMNWKKKLVKKLVKLIQSIRTR